VCSPSSTLLLFTKWDSCASLGSMRNPASALIAFSILFSASFTAAQSLPRPSLEMATSGGRDGACSASMKDGRSLVTGGKDASGPLTSAKYFEGAGRLKTVSPMLAARTDHVCMGLDDGTVLVAGGVISKNTATNAAEIFHPDSNTWTPTGPMLTARRRAAAVRLNDGKILIAGGEVSGQVINTFEIYDPVENRFEQAAGTLSAARTGYALAPLSDGKVIVAGGFENGRALDSMDLYDPAIGITYAGRMSTPRANFTATALDDGKVLFVGGSDGAHELNSAEVYDSQTGESSPAGSLSTARHNHIAIRSSRNGSVLIVGGAAGGKTLNSGEVFVVSQNAFEPAAEAGNGESASITIGILGSDATVRAVRTYRLPQPRVGTDASVPSL
jgi:hypothetical protein